MKEKNTRNRTIKISVIVPAYNVEKYISDCVKSIISQEYKNIEIIIVNDGSTDETRHVCEGLCKTDSRIRLINTENLGVINARRLGTELALGEYVSYVDGDDWIEPNLYSGLIDYIEKYSPDMIAFSNYYREYENGGSAIAFNSKKKGFWKQDEYTETVLSDFIKNDCYFFSEYPGTCCAYLYKKALAFSCWDEMPTSIRYNEDFAFVFSCILASKTFAAYPILGYHYRMRNGSTVYSAKKSFGEIQITYTYLNQIINNSKYDDKEFLFAKNLIYTHRSLMLTDYDFLISNYSDCLFPYSSVVPGSKIIIYGMGIQGRSLLKSLSNQSDYTVVGIVDKNIDNNYEYGCQVYRLDDLSIVNDRYDYIVIAISFGSVVEQVKMDLKKQGVPKEKIAEIDMSLMVNNNFFGKNECEGLAVK